MAFMPISEYLYVRVWCEPRNLLKNQISTTLVFFFVCNPISEDVFIKTTIRRKIGAFKLVIRLSG